MRAFLSSLLVPLFLGSLVLAFNSTGLALAIYILTLAVSLLAFVTLYLQHGLEEQLLTDLSGINEDISNLSTEIKEQKEDFLYFREQVIELDSRYDQRITIIEDKAEEVSYQPRIYQKVAPVVMILLLSLITFGVLYPTPHESSDIATQITEPLPPLKTFIVPDTERKPAKNEGALPEETYDAGLLI